MAMTIVNNPSAMLTLGELNKNNNTLTKSLKKVSSGMRINSAGDDASGYAISEKMRVKIRGLSQDDRNMQSGLSMMRVVMGGLENIKHSVENMARLADQAACLTGTMPTGEEASGKEWSVMAVDTLTDQDRAMLQKEFNQMKEHIDDVAYGTFFNGIPVLAPLGEQESPTGGRADIVFMVDTTGSMSSYIRDIAGQIRSFAENLKAKDVDYRFAIVSFNDVDDEAVRIEAAFTNDDTDIENILNQISSEVQSGSRGGGGDWPESALEGIMDSNQGVLTLPFRDNAKKQIIAISDADFHERGESGDGNPADYLDADDVIAALQANKVVVSAVTQTSGNELADWSKLINATGGTSYDINGDYGKSLDTVAEKLQEGYLPEIVQTMYFQEGTKANENIAVRLYNHDSLHLGVKDMKIGTLKQAISTRQDLNTVLDKVLNRATYYGSIAMRLEYADANIITAEENTVSSESTIRDADMAKEMMEYTKANVLAQASQSMLAQANQNSSQVMSLLQ